MRKYLATGEEVELVQKLDKRYLVEVLVTGIDYEGEEITCDCGLRVVDKVFDKPPVALIDGDISAKKKELDALEAQIDARRVEFLEQEKVATQRLAKLKKHEKLKRLEDFLDGKISHLVLDNYGRYQILTVEEAKCNYDKHKLRLLSLLGGSNGDIEWRLGYYSDGSGSNTECTPCTSYEEAKAVVQAIIDKGFDKDKSYQRQCIVELAEKHGLTIPQAWVDERIAAIKAEKDKRVKELEQKLADAKAA